MAPIIDYLYSAESVPIAQEPTEREMRVFPTRAREMCSTMDEVFQLTIQAQTRALARAAKGSSTKESIRETMRADCAKLGILDLDRDLPPVVHVAGTKGAFEYNSASRGRLLC